MPDQIAYGQSAPGLEQIRTRHGTGPAFYVSFLIFLLILAAYGGLVFLNRAQADAEKELLAQIVEKRQELRPELVQQIFALEQRFRTMQALIQKHPFPSKTFTWLERHTHPRVSFSSFSYEGTARTLLLAGATDSLVSLNQQIAILQHDTDIEKIDFGGLAFNEQGIAFNTTVVFKPSFLQAAP